MKNNILKIVSIITFGLILTGCGGGGGGDTTEVSKAPGSSTGTVIPIVNCDQNSSTVASDCPFDGLAYTCIEMGDLLVKDVENTVVRIVDIDHNATKRVCVQNVEGVAHIERN